MQSITRVIDTQIKKDSNLPKVPLMALGIPILFLLFIIIFNMLTYRVLETQHAVVSRFGQVVKVIVSDNYEGFEAELTAARLNNIKVVEGKGLFFKAPFIETVDYHDSRLLTYDTDPREVTTRDKKKLILDNYAQWRIVNPVLFQVSMKNERTATTRLDDIIYSKMNEKIGRTDANTLVSDKAYVYALLDEVTNNANAELGQYGIEVVDVRIKRTDLPVENSQNIFNRMRTERERMATQYRSEGLEEAQKIRSEADKQATIIEAQAYAQAEQIEGQGEAEALRIYANAYNRDPEFYNFYRSLEAYRETLQGETKIVIDANSEFAKYLFGPR